MRRQYKLIFTCLIAFTLGFGGICSAQTQAVEKDQDYKMMMEITRGMVCLCGCGNLILATCTCGDAQAERAYVLSLVKMGKSREDIVAAMIKKKGTEVLAAPEKKGLNWILWVVIPYILPVVAMIMVGYLLLAWSSKKTAPDATPIDSTETDADDDKYLQKLKEELDEFS